jgi:hypothetical protein
MLTGLRSEDLRLIEELIEKEIRLLPAGSWNYGRWKALTKTLDAVREAM